MTQKLALITGASRGLGAALAEALAPTHHIIAVARTTGGLEELDDRIKALGGSATLAPMDITIPEAMATLCRGIHDRWGKLDLWLHSAIHATALCPAPSVAPKDWDKAFAINATATSVLIPYLAPLLGQNGKAVFFDDARAGEKFYGTYGATKAAQMALARSWQAETLNTGPVVEIVEPAPMPTALRARFFPGEDRTVLANIRDEAQRLLPQILG
ncbi:oxidoreductase, short-chain dehydrogenase/reductase family protein [Roseobacter sp. SK209-2-6]|uniref:SDR family NAD(P)-dependent oxidoreductase n=1 Tax=Roseobacter sp. SK209-2-6 TaxID=388739 RepID=UPI0000F3CF93|nr:SDR family NAD(P)-dependent oxidoreductase [Roseobacter sp. SK209-2-6]EBA15272.1 oxidoreductase, short-chain dehydrogenase/reductase family protein [Roseobacter sp. SK209-2-6]